MMKICLVNVSDVDEAMRSRLRVWRNSEKVSPFFLLDQVTEEQHRYILFCYNMPLAKNRILFHTGDNLCDIVAEHLSDCLRCLHKLHIIPHSKYYFCK